MRIHIGIRFAAVVIAMLAPAGVATAQSQYRDRVDTAVTLEPGGTLSVSLYSGRVNVTAGTGSRATIRGTANRGELSIRARSNSVSISVDSEGHTRGGGDLEIAVPRGTRVVLEGFSTRYSVRGLKADVSAETLSGSLTVGDAEGKVTLETVSGDINVTDVDGDVSAESVSGSVDITNVQGDIITESVSGPITIARARSARVHAETVQSSLSYEGTIEPMGDYGFTTHSGKLTLAVPANAGATVSLETFSGSVESDFPVTLESGANRRAGESQFDFRIGDGRSRIVLETFSGDIRIQRGASRRE
jgi:DUF4097 and DUF4098 domain-containing protein YvlB